MKKLNIILISILLIIILAIGVFAVPTVNLLTPEHNFQSSEGNINFQCDISDLTNLTNTTLYIWNSAGVLDTNYVTIYGLYYVPSWSINLPKDVYQWNCLAYNNQSEFSWAPSNYTLNINIDDPEENAQENKDIVEIKTNSKNFQNSEQNMLSSFDLELPSKSEIFVSSKIEQELKSEEKVRVIITLKNPKSINEWRSRVSSMSINKIKTLEKDMRNTALQQVKNTKHRYNSFNGFSAEITQEELESLINTNLIERIVYDKPVHAFLQDSLPLINATSAWGLQDNNALNLTGKGQTVCLIDTGVNYTHSDIDGCTNFASNVSITRNEEINSSGYPNINYSDGLNYVWIANVNYSGYDGISLYFSVLDVEEGYDAVLIYDKDYNLLRWYTGNNTESFWTGIFYEDLLQVVIFSDNTINRTGFNISQSKAYNFTHNSSCTKVIEGYDFANGDPDPIDDNGHGTHCAGIISANGSIQGVAPDAKIVAVKALDINGSGWDSDIIAGIEYCNNLGSDYNISVISMSLGGGNYTGYCDASESGYSAVINASFNQNISVIVASGNNYSGHPTQISSPACIEKAIPVTATNKSDIMADFAQRNSLVQLTAPGVNINSTKGSPICLGSCSCSGDYMICSGTSMATPHVAGAFAIYYQDLESYSESMTPWEIESAFNETGVRINDTSESGLFYSRIDVLEALLAGFEHQPINVTLTYPSDAEIINQSSFSLNYSVNVNANCTLYDNISGDWAVEVNNIHEGEWSVDINPSNGNYEWNVHCFEVSNDTNEAWAEDINWTFTVNATIPSNPMDVNITYPLNGTTIYNIPFDLNYSINLGSNCTQYIWNSSGDNVYNSSLVSSGAGSESVQMDDLDNGNYEWNVNCSETGNSSNNAWANETNNISFTLYAPSILVSKSIINGDDFDMGDTIEYKINITNEGPTNLTYIWLNDEFNRESLTLNYTNQTSCTHYNFTNGNNAFVNINVTPCMIEQSPSGLTTDESFIVYINLTVIGTEGGANNIVTINATDQNGVEIYDSKSAEANINVDNTWNQGLNDWQSKITSPYIKRETSKELNFTIYRQAGQDSCLQNITITLPNSNFTFNGYNDSSIPESNYTFSNSIDKLIWQATGDDFFCGEGPENFYVNITSIDDYNSANFNVLAYYRNESDEINLTMFTTSEFSYNGTIYDINGQPLCNATASLTVLSFTNHGDVTLGTFTDETNSNGVFNITAVPGLNASIGEDVMMGPGEMNGLFYRLAATKYNDSNNYYAMYVGPSMPELPEQEIRSDFGLADPDIYLKPAVTFYIQVYGRDYKSGPVNDSYCNENGCSDEAFNLTNIGFNYGLKDKRLGYSVSSDHTTQEIERYIAAALNRNYSLMVFPESSFPLYIDFENISTNCNTTGYNISADGLDATCTRQNGTYFIDAVISSEQDIKTFNGSINMTGLGNFTIVAYMMGAGEMLFDQDTLPFNMGQMMRWPSNNSDYDDNYDLTTGNYSIFLPATDATSTIMLIAFAEKGGDYYYDIFKLLSSGLDFTGGAEHDFNMSILFDGTNISIDSSNISADWNDTNVVNTKGIKFNLVSNGSLLENENAFIDISLERNDIEYLRMTDASEGVFSFPLAQDESIKKLTVYSQSYSPVSTPVSASVLSGTENTSTINCSDGVCDIELQSFGEYDPFDADVPLIIDFYKSNLSCDVPNPSAECSYTAGQGTNKSAFSPLKMILMGDISLRMSRGNLSVHYTNTDLLASGPPDAMFDTNNSGTDLEAAWKFGSQGPEIYADVLISVPYSDELDDVNISIDIPLLYDNEFNVIWNMSAGDDTDDILNNDTLEDYRDYLDTDYEDYLDGTGVLCDEDDENLTTNLCYRDTDNRILWMKIPHFSGIGPRVSEYTPDDDGGSSGGSSTFSSYWSSTREVSMDSLNEGLVRPLKEKQRLRYYIGGSRHYIGIVGMTATSVTVNLSSTPQQATINIGETKKFEVTDDYYYDISIKLNSINTTSNEAELFIKYINESMNITTTAITNNTIEIVTTNETSPNADQEDKTTNSDTEETKIELPKLSNPLNLILFILIILGLVGIIFLVFYKKK